MTKEQKAKYKRGGTKAASFEFSFFINLYMVKHGSELCDIYSLGTFLALYNVELDFLSFFKGLEAFTVNSRIMNEHVVSF